MIFNRLEYLVNDKRLIFKKIDSRINDNRIANIKITERFQDSNLCNYNIRSIDLMPNFLVMKKPLSYKCEVKFENYANDYLNNEISVDTDEAIKIINDDVLKKTNGIKNRINFLTYSNKWTKIDNCEIDNNLFKNEKI